MPTEEDEAGGSRLGSEDSVVRFDMISHTVFLKSFCKIQCPYKSVNLVFILVKVQDELTDLWGS